MTLWRLRQNLSAFGRTGGMWASVLAALVFMAQAARASEFPQPDRIVVLKRERVLQLMHGDEVLKSYPIGLGRHPVGPKRRKGDGRTPEGVYRIDARSRTTHYHLALHLSYPGPADTVRARAGGYNPGGGIYIHGMPPRFGRTDPARFFVNWTNGCIAVGNHAIEEIWATVPDGTPVEIRP